MHLPLKWRLASFKIHLQHLKYIYFKAVSNGTPVVSNGIPVLLPGKSHGQRSVVGYSPWGRKESDMTEGLWDGIYETAHRIWSQEMLSKMFYELSMEPDLSQLPEFLIFKIFPR